MAQGVRRGDAAPRRWRPAPHPHQRASSAVGSGPKRLVPTLPDCAAMMRSTIGLSRGMTQDCLDQADRPRL